MVIAAQQAAIAELEARVAWLERAVPGWRRQLLVAATPLLTCYRLGDRTLASFAGFVLPDLAGVMVHDRYPVFDRQPLETGHTRQLLTPAHA